MLEETKEIIKNYSIMGAILGALIMLIRPFVSVKETIRNLAIVYCFTVLAGLVLDNWKDVFSESTRYGMSGVLGYYAVRFYEISIVILDNVKKHPERLIRRIKKNDDKSL